jgi:hypothetical protein
VSVSGVKPSASGDAELPEAAIVSSGLPCGGLALPESRDRHPCCMSVTRSTAAGRAGSAAIAAGAALALADGSIVVLALPQLLTALDTSVEGVAAVIGVYTAVLALALLPAEALRRRAGSVAIGTGGFVLFALASLICGFARSLPLMLTMRAGQALGAAAALVAAFALLEVYSRRGGAGRIWVLVAIVGTAAGPALGGALTQAFSWQAIFFVQAPVGLCAALACWMHGPASAAAHDWSGPSSWSWRPGIALALISAALSAVLFLLVLVLVAGWAYEPLAGAALLTVLPLSALAAMRVGGEPRVRATAGSLLIAGGVAALAPIATASAWWVIAPEAAAGVGMGLVLPALSESLLPERTPADAARVLTARHAGITVALLVLAPIIAARLDGAIRQAQEREVAIMLDSRIDPLSKVRLVGQLASGVGRDAPRRDLQRSFRSFESTLGSGGRLAVAAVEKRADQVVVTAVSDTFWPAFLIAGAFALGGAALVMPRVIDRRVVVAAGVALALPLATAGAALAVRPAPPALTNPCRAPPPPGAGGLAGTVQDAVIRALDAAACRFGSSREELVLALASSDAARRYKAEHGVDPRSPVSLAEGLLGGGAGGGSLGSLLKGLVQ